MKNNQLRRYHALVRQLNLNESEREALLLPFGVSSSKDLTPAQLTQICDALQKDADTRHNPPINIRRMRSRVITWLEANGYYKNGGNWDRANAFLEQKRIAGKRLYALTEEELKALLRKLAAIDKQQAERKEMIDNQTRWN